MRSDWRSSWDAKRCKRSAKQCNEKSNVDAQKKTPKPLHIADLGDAMPIDAIGCESRPGGTRTPDKGIMSPLL